MRLALVIGNSRLHWVLLSRETIMATWDTEHVDQTAIASLFSQSDSLGALLQLAPQELQQQMSIPPPLLIASVVPEQTERWRQHIPAHLITLDQIPLQGLYSSMGIDRALAVFGAGQIYGFPNMVIDGGTALTLTGVDGDRRIIGGAILPGLRLQGRSLTQQTATLPDIEFSLTTELSAQSFPTAEPIPRWATTTAAAIRSGIVHTVLSGIRDFVDDWQRLYPESPVLLTGGDGAFLQQHIHSQFHHLDNAIHFDAALTFKGVQALLT
ncbi:MAG: pantothenate kinase [Cyanobacteria bacterium P01_A01_bin.37]